MLRVTCALFLWQGKKLTKNSSREKSLLQCAVYYPACNQTSYKNYRSYVEEYFHMSDSSHATTKNVWLSHWDIGTFFLPDAYGVCHAPRQSAC